jgi:hypothetical protein
MSWLALLLIITAAPVTRTWELEPVAWTRSTCDGWSPPRLTSLDLRLVEVDGGIVLEARPDTKPGAFQVTRCDADGAACLPSSARTTTDAAPGTEWLTEITYSVSFPSKATARVDILEETRCSGPRCAPLSDGGRCRARGAAEGALLPPSAVVTPPE